MEEKKVNKVLRHERELRGWSQQVVAERVGTTEQVVSRWEGGFHRPNKYFQAQLCELFGKSAEELGLIDPLQDVVAEKPLACVTRLRETIHYLGKSEEQVAQDLSMSKRTLSHYMYGKVVVPDELRAQFAAYLGCTEAFLFPHPSLWLPDVVKEGVSEPVLHERAASDVPLEAQRAQPETVPPASPGLAPSGHIDGLSASTSGQAEWIGTLLDVGEKAVTSFDGSKHALLLTFLGDETAIQRFDPAKRETLHLLRQVFTAAALTLAGSQLVDPEPWERLSAAHVKPTALDATTLQRFEHLLGECWQLSNLNELETAKGILSSFLPNILALPTQNVDSRVAFLASQGLRLQSILAHHHLKLSDKVLLCEQSVHYARSANHTDTLTAALMELAVAYKYNGQPDQWFKTLQEALYYCPQISPLLQSQVYFKSALVFAYHKRMREAALYVQMAEDIFPDHPESDPGYAFADVSVYTFSRDGGRARLEMGQTSDAWNIFEMHKQKQTSLESPIPERVRLEIVHGQSRVAIHENDRDKYAHFLKDGLAGAVALGSKKRFDEAYKTFKEEMPGAWLENSDIQAIAEQYHLMRE